MKQRFRFLAVTLPIWVIAAALMAFALWGIQGINFAISFVVALLALTPAFFPQVLHFKRISNPEASRMQNFARVVFRGVCYAVGLIAFSAILAVCRLWSQGRLAELSILQVDRPELLIIPPFILCIGIGFAIIQDRFPDK